MKFRYSIVSVSLVFAGGGLRGFAQKRIPPPFGIDKRPPPSGTDLSILLPKKVGTFERADFPAGLKPPTDEG
jgi:hypothetical protein